LSIFNPFDIDRYGFYRFYAWEILGFGNDCIGFSRFETVIDDIFSG
jgi:hypothetical protein